MSVPDSSARNQRHLLTAKAALAVAHARSSQALDLVRID